MGCWNETCGLTQMPIEGGDSVRLFLLVKNRFSQEDRDSALHYASDLWRPFGLPLKGTYDEYGRIENIEEDCMTDMLLESIKEMVIEVPDRMGNAFKRQDLNWETVIEFLTDEGLRIADPFDVNNITKKLDKILAEVKALVPNLPENGWSMERSNMADKQKEVVNKDSRAVTMYHMMVHEDVYQAVLNYKVPAERFSSWTGGDIKEVMRQGAKDYVAQVRADLVARSKMSSKELEAMDRIKRITGETDLSNRFISITNYLDGSYGSGSYLRKYLAFVEKKIAEGAADDDPAIVTLTEQFVGFAAFSQTMTLMRKLWMPQTGKGGQDREYALHKYMGQVISDFSDKKIKQWDELYGGDDEENK